MRLLHGRFCARTKRRRSFNVEESCIQINLFVIFGSVGGCFGQRIFGLDELWNNVREQIETVGVPEELAQTHVPNDRA